MSRNNGGPQAYPGSSGPRSPPDAAPRPMMSPQQGSQTNMSRAQRFESEKQRIQESCFAKLDEHGQQAESYITHLRVEEDGAYPSMPPPLESPADNKKARVIIVAVKSTGRVRIHKARENHTGTFSIGKTWNMEDVSAIESFNYVGPDATQQRRAQCQLAGPLGFVVTIGKPYYWRAATPKERDFFIASLIKIFRKYTKGRVPELHGFDDNERNQLLGPLGPASQQTPRSQDGALSPPGVGAPIPRPLSRGSDTRSASTGNGSIQPGMAGTPGGPPSSGRQVPPPRSSDGPQGPQDPRGLPDQGLGIRTFEGQGPERMRRPSGDGPPPVGMRRPSREMPGMRRPSGDNLRAPAVAPIMTRNGRTSPQSATDGQMARGISPAGSQTSIPSRGGPPRGPPGPQRASIETARSAGAGSDRLAASTNTQPTEVSVPIRSSIDDHADGSPPKPTMLPERRRPPLNLKELTPTATTTFENEDLRPPPLSTARTQASASPSTPAVPGTFIESPEPSPSPLPVVEPAVIESDAKSTAAKSLDIPEVARDGSAAATPEFQTPEGPSPSVEKTEEEAARPGLGPMFKKRDVAATFRRAATAANAFKPRAGGAGDRLKKLESGGTDQDGVHGVVPAPLRGLDLNRTDSVKSTPQSVKGSPQLSRAGSVTKPPAADQPTPSAPVVVEAAPSQEASLPTSASKMSLNDGRPVVKQKRRTTQQEKYLASLGLDPALFENRGLEFEFILSEMGWGSDILQPNQLEQLENDLKREIGRVEAGSWLNHIDQKDDRVNIVDRMLDRAIAECDELDGLLTLYSVELGTLNEDISFIEAQSQGLQVQTANQKILQAELQSLVDTMTITPDQLAALQQGSFDTDLDLMEQTLTVLYQAMLTIDPSIKSTGPLTETQLKASDSERSELANMHALQERRDDYLADSERFCRRVVNHVGAAFDSALNQAIPSLMKPMPGQKGPSWKLHPQACNAARVGLWQYSPLMLYAKEVSPRAWRHLLNQYTDIARPLYQTVFRTALDSHKKNVQASTGDDAMFLFTAAEKEPTEGLALATRKLTMKRSQTLARSTRISSGEKAKMLQSGRQRPYEAFAEMLSQWAPTVVMEQNFVVEFFHATSMESMDFVDAIQYPPEQRRGPSDLAMPRIAEPDRSIADHVQRAMQTMFEFWLPELIKLVEESTLNDPVQSIGMMGAIAVFSAPLHETSQDFLMRSLTDTNAKLGMIFNKFIDAQVHAIEDTKVMLKKRKGVISFIRTFPHFSTALENVFTGSTRSAPANSNAASEVRQVIDEAYERINQSMWVALKHIAKDVPTSTGAVSAESEDKEILNYHILLIENMNHYIIEVDADQADSVLAAWKAKAQQERTEHLEQYVTRVVRRPLGKMLDFIESTESLLSSSPSARADPSSIASKPSHARPAAKRVFAQCDARELRKGIDALRKRVEKHFDPAPAAFELGGGDAHVSQEERQVMQRLVVLVLDACEARYLSVLERATRVVAEVYGPGNAGAAGEKGVEVEFGREDVLAGFKR